MNKKLGTRLAVPVMLSFLCFGAAAMPVVPVYATGNISATATGELHTGGINVTLDTKADTSGDVQPGQKVGYEMTVTNNGMPAYVRVHVEYSGLEGADDNILQDVSEDWVKQGDYWYYKKPVGKNETVTFVKEIQIPDVDHLSQTTPFKVSAKAQGVQSDNFTPDFSNVKPWGAVEVEESNPDVGDLSEESDGFRVKGTNGVKVKQKHVFDNVNSLMPGDTAKDSVTVEAPAGKDMYMDITNLTAPEGAGENINLIISKDDVVIYDGALEDAEDEVDGINIGKTASDTGKAKIRFELELSKNLTNNTAWKSMGLTAKIYQTDAKDDGNAQISKIGTDPTKGGDAAEGKTNDSEGAGKSNPLTGDSGRIILFGGAAAAAAVGIGVTAYAKKKKKEEETEKA